MKLIYGDNRIVLPTIDTQSIDLTVTSPPYDSLRTYNGSLVWNFELFQDVAKELFRVTKPGGVVVWVVGDSTIKGSETGSSFKQALYFKEIGFNLHDTMIYAKKAPLPLTHNRYEQQFEYMFVFSKGKPKTFNGLTETTKPRKTSGTHRQSNNTMKKIIHVDVNATRLRYNIWFINNTLTPTTRYGHPAPFPIELARDHILSWSNEGDTVLDPFMGSGTTGQACVELNRYFIGIEKVHEYYVVAENRLIPKVS